MEQLFTDRSSVATEGKFNVSIFSNKDTTKSVDLTSGIVEFKYYESILSDTMRVEFSFVDTGNSIDKKSITESLPLVGTEKVDIVLTDNKEVVIGDNPKLTMYVNKVTPVFDDSSRQVINISLVSKEFILNKKINLTDRFDGRISDTVTKILTDQNYLATKKTVDDIEETQNNFNFIGNNKKPLYTLNWLSKKAVSYENQSLDNNSGYFLYETSLGFHFKSIDGLLKQEHKKSFIYNNTSIIPKGYDGKALTYDRDNLINARSKFEIGTYDTRIVMFDPFTTYYEVKNITADQENLELGGKEFPKLNEEFDTEKPFTRTTYYVLDTGTIPSGGTEDQLKKSKEENFIYGDIANQATMRYNQFFSFKSSITISGDFSLHAGDAIFLDVPRLEAEQTKKIDTTDGGLYIITDLCHFISPQGTFTKLNLIRDSFGRSGNHSKSTSQGVI